MRINTFLLVFALCLGAIGLNAQTRTCAAHDIMEQQNADPKTANQRQQIEQFTQNIVANNPNSLQSAVITIPIVFHVVYRTAAENISDAQIMSQLQVLNDDFRRLNSDASNTPSDFSCVAADIELEFCLAQVDPDGNPTTGITRTSTSVNGFGTNDAVKFTSSGGIDAWPSCDYLNFWVCNIGGGILGYAQFPGGAAATDGVVNGYQYTGAIGTATAPFNLGRTATHEVGHWLNLRHIWGDTGCGGDDFVADTPLAGGANYTGAPCTYPGPNSCNNNQTICDGNRDYADMFQNYMDYSDDGCMNLFTEGQKARMLALFAAGGARECLVGKDAIKCTVVAPTCDDGIQNQDETDIDCGGATCPACPPSCTDGIMNQDETGIDCGGATCPACPTCNDGIQNQDETGIDCGGATCPACPETCNDGIQNQDETGVDCGGATCPECVAGDCNSPIPLVCGTPYNGTTNGEANDDTNYTGATYPYTGGDLIFVFTIAPGTIDLTLSGLTDDLDLLVMDDCNGGSVLVESTNGGTANEVINANSTTGGTFYIVVDGYQGATGDFTLTIDNCVTDPTCFDAVQNGNETGVDCGGPDCPACPTADISLTPKVFLQGPLSGTTMGANLTASGVMLPTVSPYADAKPATTAELAGMVDWVYVEIRDAATGLTVLAAQSGLLQPDGTVIDTDGTALTFPLAAGSYHVAIHHRNHLGIMTANPVTLN